MTGSPCWFRFLLSWLARATPILAGVAIAVTLGVRPVRAQDAAPSRGSWELIVPSGRFIPVGSQRGRVRSGGLTAIQVSRVTRPTFAITSTLGWARSRDASTARSKLDVFLVDMGGELRSPGRRIGEGGRMGAFAGVGGGVRAYNHRDLRLFTKNVAVYGSVGGQVGRGRAHLRLEVRDCVAGFQDFTQADRSHPRNDMVVLVGLRLGSR